MKTMEYHLFDVVFVIEGLKPQILPEKWITANFILGTASCGVHLDCLRSNYIIPALEFFSQGMEDIYSPSNKSASSLFGIVTFKTSQCIASCNTFGPYISKSDFLKAMDIDNLEWVASLSFASDTFLTFCLIPVWPVGKVNLMRI